MSYKYILNPNYEYFLDNLKNIQEIFNDSNNTIHKARNELKIIEIASVKYVIKSFKIPHFINRVAYSFFRDGKAKKSYLNAMQLHTLQVNTPEPVGVIEFFKDNLLHESYFVSIYEPYDFTIREALQHKRDDYKEVIRQFTNFTYAIHKKGVWHVDYSPGNILITSAPNNQYIFSLVDINRMSFQKISAKEGCHNFNKLWATKADTIIIAREYAQLSSINEEEALLLIQQSQLKIENMKKNKQKLKNIKNTLLKLTEKR